MSRELDRRKFLGVAGAGVAAGVVPYATLRAEENSGLKILGVSCSPRKGRTTAASVGAALNAARDVSSKIDVELIDLGGMRINGSVVAGLTLEPGERDDFPKLVPILSDPRVAGIIVGSPVYFANMSSLCKSFLECLAMFRKNSFALSNRVAGVLAVGGARNGGQELTIQSIQAALLCQEMIIAGDGRPSARIGGTLWNQGGNISSDESGLQIARNLGRRVAELALLVASRSGSKG